MERRNKYISIRAGFTASVMMNLANYGCSKSESLTEGFYQGQIEGNAAVLAVKPSVVEQDGYDCKLIFNKFQVSDLECDGRILYTEGTYGSFRNQEAIEAKSEWITQAKSWVKSENKITKDQLEQILQ